MGKGFIYQIDENGNRLGNNIDVYSEIMTCSVKFTSIKGNFTQLKNDNLIHYSDDDVEFWCGDYKIEFIYKNTITATKNNK